MLSILLIFCVLTTEAGKYPCNKENMYKCTFYHQKMHHLLLLFLAHKSAQIGPKSFLLHNVEQTDLLIFIAVIYLKSLLIFY